MFSISTVFISAFQNLDLVVSSRRVWGVFPEFSQAKKRSSSSHFNDYLCTILGSNTLLPEDCSVLQCPLTLSVAAESNILTSAFCHDSQQLFYPFNSSNFTKT